MKIALSVIAIVFASATEANAADRLDSGDLADLLPAPEPTVSVEQARSCPTRDAVAAALSPALANLRPGLDPLPSDLRIVDLGDAFEVATGGQSQRYADTARDCAERARVAAVFVALVMNPPLLEPPRPPPPVAPPVSLQQDQLPPAPKRTWLSLGLAARFDSAAGGGDDSATSGTAAGGELEVAVGRGSIGIEAAAGAMTSTENTIGSVHVSQRRFPCSLSAAIHRRAGAYLEVGADLGASLTPFTLHGQGLDTALPVTRFDAGARVALELSVAGAVAPFASLHFEYFPRSYEIAVAPLGNIGTTAPIQIGLSLGLAFQARR